MAAAGRRRGRRDNGLTATDWRAIDDLDPRVTEDVLDLLATMGIAAYVQPAVDVDPVTRSATLPSRPADRLFVDRGQVAAARDCVRTLLGDRPADPDPGGSPGEPGSEQGSEPGGEQPPATPQSSPRSSDPAPRTVDATFAGIVAGFDRHVDPTAASWPAAENTEPAPAPPATGEAQPPPAERHRSGPVDGREVTESSLLDGLDTFGSDLPDHEPPERFEPPPPPPLPRLSRQTVLGWVAIAAGLILLIGRPDLLPVDRGTAMLLGFASILGGAVALILRLRPGNEPDDSHPDDGARV